jgi:Family of unknown function (DUF5335)
MKTTEVPARDWTAFFDSFSRQHQGWLVRLSVLDPKLGAQVEAHELPLQGIVADPRGRGIAIQLGARPDDLEHSVRHPRRVWVEIAGDRDDAEAAVEIESAEGTKTLLEFRCVARPESVDGLAATVTAAQ